MQVSPLTRRVILPGRLNPYPLHYRAAFAFSIFLYPTPHRLTLRFAVPHGRTPGLPRFTSVPFPEGLGPAYPPEDSRSASSDLTALDLYLVPFGSSLTGSLACST